MKFVKLAKNKAFQFTLMVGLLITSLLIILAMLLGNESGNFVFQVQEGEIDKSISITDDLENGELTNRLIAEGQKNWVDTTVTHFLGDNYQSQYTALQSLTSKGGRNVLFDAEEQGYVYAYTFYIVNTGSSLMELEIEMSMSNITKGMDNAIRVMTFNENEANVNIYQKADKQEQQYPGYYLKRPTNFVSNNTVYNEDVFLQASSGSNRNYLKYSVLVWLEGNDPECTNDIMGGTIKFAVNIRVKN